MLVRSICRNQVLPCRSLLIHALLNSIEIENSKCFVRDLSREEFRQSLAGPRQ